MYRGKTILTILTAGFLLAFYPAEKGMSQQVVIEGRVVLERSSPSTVTSGLNGYQTSTSSASSASASTDSASNQILVWLESRNQKSFRRPADTTVPVLDQVNKQFKPKLLAVRVGENVRIKNSDPIYHNVFSLSRTKRFDVGRRPPGDYEEVSFDETGIVDVFCDIHSDMHAVIVVMPEQTVRWKKLAESGNFRFEGVPQGDYRVHFYALGDLRRSVDIRAIDMKKVTLETIRLDS